MLASEPGITRKFEISGDMLTGIFNRRHRRQALSSLRSVLLSDADG